MTTKRRGPLGGGGLPTRALLAALFLALGLAAPEARAQNQAGRGQERPTQSRVPVPLEKIEIDDGDTVDIQWTPTDHEIVRILGIDTPEITHIDHGIPLDQSFGTEAKAFCMGVLAASQKVELLRAETKDPYGRTLGYLFVDGVNYSVLVVRARLAVESISRYGDNGFPKEAAEVLEAARAVAPAPFENPGDFRKRMREINDWEKAHKP